MSNTLIELIGDKKIPADAFRQLLDALDRAKTPKILEVKVDYDGITNSNVMDLIGATQNTSLETLHMAFTEMDASFARNLLEAGIANRQIAKCWFLLGAHQFYCRTGVLLDVHSMIQLHHNPKNVTIECDSLDDKQTDVLVNALLCSSSKHLTLIIHDITEDKALAISERLRSEHCPFETMKLQLGKTTLTVEPIEEELDLVQQLSTLMFSVQSDVSELSSVASNAASNWLQTGRTWINGLRFSNPITGCMSQPVTDDLLGDEPPLSPTAREKARMNKLD